MPSEAIRELDDDPERVVLTVLDMRGFERTWRAIDVAKSSDEVPTGDTADRVKAAIAVRLESDAEGSCP